MRKKIFLGLCSLITFFAFTISVYAGNVTLSVTGNDTVVVNNNIDIIVKASDIEGLTKGLATAQGDLSYDSNYLEYVKSEDVSSTLSVSYGTKTKRFVALGLSGEYISNSENLIKITFKAKQVGTTKVSINNVVVGDTKAIIHGSDVLPKTINIINESSDIPSNNNQNQTVTTIKKPAKAPSKNNNSSKSSDATLSKLLINSAKISPEFNKDVNTYSVTVSKDVNKLQFDYATTDKNAKVNVVGNNGLKDNEENVIEIIVTAEDGTTNTYTLNVKKSDEVIDNRLKSLDVKESRLTFDEDNFEYNLTVGSSVDKLTIEAIPKSKYSTVKIIGNSNLGKGDNLVLIKLTDKNGYTNFYKLNVKKENSKTIFGIKIKYILYFVFFLLLLLLLFFIFLLILILLKKKKRKKKEAIAKEEVYLVQKDDLEKLREPKSQFKPEEENVDIYDDVVTKDELIDAIEERNPKKLKMLLAQEEANKLKEELMQEENEDE